MREESQRASIEGHLLHRLTIHPADGVQVCAEAIFYHGQGDYADRYLDILHPFVDRGIRCIITELPGHGYSPGVRGHCGDASVLDAVIESTLENVRSRGSLPVGVMGHSMGGLLAARHLVMAGQGRLPAPSFAWLSSPLIDPAMGRHPLFLRAARFLSPVMPGLTFCTKVKPENFSAITGDDELDHIAQADQKDVCITKHKLWHNRVSLGWGTTLLDFAQQLQASVQDIPEHIPVLCTQGSKDLVCPAVIAREFFERLPNKKKRYQEISELRHEPFSGDGSEQLFQTLLEWLETLELHADAKKKAPVH